MRRLIGICALASAGGLAVAGCGGSHTAGGGATGAAIGDDPCGVMSKAEVTDITTDVVTFTDSNGATCNYHSDPKDGVQVTIYRTGGAQQMATVHNSQKVLGGIGAAAADKAGAGRDVGGLLQQDKSATPAIGDEAVWELNDALAVRKGDAFVEVSPPIMHDPATHTGYPLVSKDQKRAIAQALATKILQKVAP